MSENQNPVDAVKDALAEHDDDILKKDSDALIADAKSLTNGHAGDAVVTGRVLHGMAIEQAAQGALLRKMAIALPTLQSKKDCMFNHKSKMAKITACGMTFQLPATAAVIVAGLITWLKIK